ncbi:hypothetical protein PQZ52_01280 [Flavobacteriales bacterium]|nr:hypothetical protein [Flavobacteriales bacterium]
MVDKIDPTNQTSVEYGQSLLGRKYKQEEQYKKDSKKDARIGYAMQVLGGVDDLIKNRARRNVAESNNKITQQIIREEAEYNKLQKEYKDQAAWRNASSADAHATKLAREELDPIWENAIGKTTTTDKQTEEYEKSLKDLSDSYLNKYKENRISALPYETKEEYTAELRALLNKEAPSGLLDLALRGVGFRGNKQEELKAKIEEVSGTYNDRLRDREGVKGTFNELSPEAKLALLKAPKISKLDETRTTKEITLNGRKNTVIQVETFNPKFNRMDITFEDIDSNKIDNSVIGNVPPESFIREDLKFAEAAYRKKHPNAQQAQIHSAITNPNNVDFYNKDLTLGMLSYNLVAPTFSTSTKANYGPDLKSTFEILLLKDPDNSFLKQFNQLGENQKFNFYSAIDESANYYEKVGKFNTQGTRIPANANEALAWALQEQTVGIEDTITTERVLFPNSTAVIFIKQPAGSHALNTSPENTDDGDDKNRNKDGSAKSKEQLNADVIELTETETFQNLPVATQKEVLQNAANLGADINPDLLKAGPRPEGAQLELTGDDSFDSVRTADEMLLADEGPTMQDAQDFLAREQEMLNPSRPEFKELTREEEKQQSQEQRARDKKENEERRAKDKKERDDRITSNKKEMAYKLSPEGKEEIKIARKEKEDKIKESLYDNFIDPDRFDLTRIQRYVDGTLSKNRKKGSTKGTMGETLEKYGLENMTRPEIKKYLKENKNSLRARATKGVKTKYSPEDIRKELDDGNPVFIGDPRTGKRYEVNN